MEHCFEEASEAGERKLRSELPEFSDEPMHTLTELFLGAYLASTGVTVNYDCEIDQQHPDRSILDGKSEVRAIVEMTNFDCAQPIDRGIRNLQDGLLFCYWLDMDCLETHSYGSTEKQATHYKGLVQKLGIPYVVAAFGRMEAAIDSIDYREVLLPCLCWGRGRAPQAIPIPQRRLPME